MPRRVHGADAGDGPARRPRGPWPAPRHAPTATRSRARLAEGPITLYYGFDPTADSLHVGNLIGLLVLRRFQDAGHRPIALAGGATGMIGDPSGRSEERNLLDDDDARAPTSPASRRQIARRRSATTGGWTLVDNRDWTGDAAAARLPPRRRQARHGQPDGGQGVGARPGWRPSTASRFTEFSYMLLQANDYRWLHEHEGCELQIGGSDQWGNIARRAST